MKTEYRQRLPHIQLVGDAFFLTFRLFGSIPKMTIQTLKEKYEKKIGEVALMSLNAHQKNLEIFTLRKQYLVEYDALLDKINTGPLYLQDHTIREILEKQLHRYDNELYTLICYCIMSNHVHILIDTNTQLSEIIDDNQIEMNYQPLDIIMKKIKGPSAMLNNVITYILENPVKAKMIEKWDDYPGNYLRMESS